MSITKGTITQDGKSPGPPLVSGDGSWFWEAWISLLVLQALVSLLRCACQLPGSEEWRHRAFPRLRPFVGLGTSLCVPLKSNEQQHPAPGQAGRRCTKKTVLCTDGGGLYTAFALQSSRLSGSVFSLPMTSSPLSPFMHLFRASASLGLICLPGFVLFLSFIKALFLLFSVFPSTLLLPHPSRPHELHLYLWVMEVGEEDQPL